MSIEERQTDYRPFIKASEAEIGFGPEVTTTWLHDYISPRGQRVGVAVSEPLDGYESTLLMPQPHDYRNEPLSIRRAEILASSLKSRIALIETPGTVGLLEPDDTPEGYHVYTTTKRLSGAMQTPTQLIGAAKGNFTEHAAVQLDAATDVLSLDSSDRLVLFGESMGAVTATDMIQHIGGRGLDLSGVILHEVVNASGSHGIGRLRSLLENLGGIENDRRDIYLAENAAIGYPMLAFEQTSDSQKRLDVARKSFFKQQGLASLANGIGMRVGIEPRLVEALSRYGKKSAPEVLLSRATRSTVSHEVEYLRLQDELRAKLNRAVPIWEYSDATGEREIGHSFLMSFGRQAMHARQLRNFITDVER